MTHRFTASAGLALAASTILVVAACGSTVAGTPAPNPAAVASAAISEIPTELSIPTELLPTEIPTEIPTFDLDELPTDLSLPSGLTDLSLPTELTDLSVPTDLFNDDCISVSFAFANVGFATLDAYLGGAEAFDTVALVKAIDELDALLPAELDGDIQALREVAAESEGKNFTEVSQLLASAKFVAANDNITTWVEATCS